MADTPNEVNGNYNYSKYQGSQAIDKCMKLDILNRREMIILSKRVGVG